MLNQLWTINNVATNVKVDMSLLPNSLFNLTDCPTDWENKYMQHWTVNQMRDSKDGKMDNALVQDEQKYLLLGLIKKKKNDQSHSVSLK